MQQITGLLHKCRRCGEKKPEEDWHPSQWLRPGRWCKACMRAYYLEKNKNNPSQAPLAEPKPCRYCGSIYQPTARRRKNYYCSRDCKTKGQYRERIAPRILAAKPNDRICLHCGATLPQSMRADAKFCSVKCNEKAHALKRKLRARGRGRPEGFVRSEIAQRDKWRCGICGGRVSKLKQYPDPRAGSLDHIIPISGGGTSEKSNLRLTHLVCNLRRRDRGGGEQLLLFG